MSKFKNSYNFSLFTFYGHQSMIKYPATGNFLVNVKHSINITYTDKKCHNNQHCGQVDGYHRLEVFLLVEVCAVADDIEDDGGDDDVKDHSEQLPAQDNLDIDILD